MAYVTAPRGVRTADLEWREDSDKTMFRWNGRQKYICVECNRTAASRSREPAPRCPIGHGNMAALDRRLRIPSVEDKLGWKKFWKMAKVVEYPIINYDEPFHNQAVLKILTEQKLRRTP